MNMGRHYSFLLSPSLGRGEGKPAACWRWTAWRTDEGTGDRVAIGVGKATTYRLALCDAIQCISDQHEPADSEYLVGQDMAQAGETETININVHQCDSEGVKADIHW